uniref:Uncharacterized protein n=1 Tax=Rhizophora mucronata TaxID=61149 RepID=A0A2P2NMW4_RHIMU
MCFCPRQKNNIRPMVWLQQGSAK